MQNSTHVEEHGKDDPIKGTDNPLDLRETDLKATLMVGILQVKST